MGKILETLEKQMKEATGLSNYIIEIGVVDAHTKRKEVASVGLTNAEVLYINEHGSHVNKMPPRPVLHMTIRWAQKSGLITRTLHTCLKGVLEQDWTHKDVEKELNKMCMRMQNYCVDLIMKNDGRLAPNAPSTIKGKGFNHPLFVTGQLAGSITCRCVKKDDIQ